ncbi:hypothetical protein [Pseudomonas mucidolens]|uniref:hypothetical protein n=1 Tax=Pseudomonas mucidolens TaxID=46679 RepID=UPI0030D7D8AB
MSTLTKPNQQLRRDLKAIAFNLEQSCIDLGKLGEKFSDADAIALMGLVGYADEVKAGRIVRGKADEKTADVNCRPGQNSS